MSKVKKLLFIFICVVLVLCVSFQLFVYYLEQHKTKLYSNISKNGHKIVVREIGHNLIKDRRHLMLLSVDGVDIARFVVVSSTPCVTFPKQDIYAEDDHQLGYKLIFHSEFASGSSYFSFDVDFTRVLEATCYDLKQISQTMIFENIRSFEAGYPRW